jgi:hypothetical protein
MLTPGQAHNIQGFGPLFRITEDGVRMLLADGSYDADAVCAEITFTGTRAIIPAAGPPPCTAKRTTLGATAASACSTSSRTGAASPYDITKQPHHISVSS